MLDGFHHNGRSMAKERHSLLDVHGNRTPICTITHAHLARLATRFASRGRSAGGRAAPSGCIGEGGDGGSRSSDEHDSAMRERREERDRGGAGMIIRKVCVSATGGRKQGEGNGKGRRGQPWPAGTCPRGRWVDAWLPDCPLRSLHRSTLCHQYQHHHSLKHARATNACA